MLKNILNQTGVKSLDRKEKASINGGVVLCEKLGVCFDPISGFIDFVSCCSLCNHGTLPEDCLL
ncbi:hypothetical protein [Aquimarina muelleri]|uniref:Uncharacterized protein n=1 Tax=Aquimarina muelleri TaxID=279356 RepID=A0A918JWD7_9FLAO|nr:hypothetical protein [Aquimarina muelleri]MCX2761367.1 hypothetical protein [Aquimarina muelleri]GGX13122.1 hypothetical protein GCM10007384_13390 [Aquimarina muelleri]